MKIYDFNGKKNLCGDRVKVLREQRKMSQEELSLHLQLEGITIDRHSICRMEKGTRFVADYEMLALSRIFEVPLEKLFTD